MQEKVGPVEKPSKLKSNKNEQILKGLLYCGHCGYLLTPKPSGKKDKDGNPYLYYVCNDVNKGGKAASCELRNLPARQVEDFIIGIVSEMGRHPDVIEAALASSNQAKGKSVRSLESKIRQLDKKHREVSDQLQVCMNTGCIPNLSRPRDEFETFGSWRWRADLDAVFLNSNCVPILLCEETHLRRIAPCCWPKILAARFT